MISSLQIFELEPLVFEISTSLKVFMFLILRPLGFTMMFMPFSYTLGPIFLIRFALAIAFVLPIYAPLFAQTALIASNSLWEQGVFVFTEVFIGMMFGVIASLPFWTIRFAAGYIDAYRGENNPSEHEITGESLTSTSIILNATALLIFATNDGFTILFETLYWTYYDWKFEGIANVFKPEFMRGALTVMDCVMRYMLIIGLPLIIIMLAGEFIVLFIERIFRKAQTGSLNTIIKSLFYLFCLPVYIVMFADFIDKNFTFIHMMRPIFEEFTR